MSQAKEWAISIESRSEIEQFRVTVVLKGQPDEQICDFTCKLPPDLPAMLAADDAQAATLRGLPWRKALDDLPSDQIYFYAGNRKTLSTIGDRLFDALFRDPAGDDHAEVLVREIAYARRSGDFLKVTLDLSAAPELVGVPWEAAFYKKGGYFLATDAAANLVRVLPGGPSAPPPPIVGPVRVLIVIANPFPDRKLDVDKERAQIAAILSAVPVTATGAAAFEVLPPLVDATRSKLRRAMTDLNPHVVHFIGHGAFVDQSGFIALQGDEPGKADLVDADAWRLFFQNDKPWLAFLNSCQGAQAEQGNLFGGTAQGLIQAGVPFVVAMQFPISDPAAILFASEFYRALAKGEPVVQAVLRGRNAIASDDACAPELITPVVYSSGVAETLPLAAPPTPVAVPPKDEPPPPAPAVPPPATDQWRKIALVSLVVLALAAVALASAMFGLGNKADRAVSTSAPMPDEGSSGGAAPTDEQGETDAASGGETAAPSRPHRSHISHASAPDYIPTRARPRRAAHAIVPVRPPPAGGGYAWNGGAGEYPPPSPPPPPPPSPPPPPGSGYEWSGGPGGSPYPPPPPPAPVCDTSPHVVFFDWDAAEITPEASSILDNAISAYGNCGNASIVLSGHTDRSGPARYNLRLAEHRNGSVQDYLIAHGFPEGLIAGEAFGETQPRVPTADGVRELQNRRVEITYGPGFASDPADAADPAETAGNPPPSVTP